MTLTQIVNKKIDSRDLFVHYFFLFTYSTRDQVKSAFLKIEIHFERSDYEIRY